MALLELEKIKKDINTLFGYVRCLMAKSDENCPLVATEWSSNHSTVTGNPYTAGTYVFYNGHVYKCKFNNDGILPTNTTYWLDLGEGHLLAEEQTDWNATGGRRYIVNKPTNTSDFINDGEDGSSPYVTQDEMNAALADPQNLDEVLAEGDEAPTRSAKVGEVGLWDDFVAPFGYAKIFADKSRIYFQSKLGNLMFQISETGWQFLKNPWAYGFNFQTLTGNRTATWQDKSGVVAFLGDIRSYGLYSQTQEGPLVIGTTEGTLIGPGLGTLSVSPNLFQIGDSFHLRVSGKITNSNNQQLVIQLKSNGNIIGTTGTITVPTTTDKNWELTTEFTVILLGTAGNAKLQTNGKFIYNKNSNNAFEGIAFDYTDSINFDTTILNTLDITATWLTSNPINSIHTHQLTLTKIY